MTEDERKLLREWLRSRPKAIRDAALAFPPGATVRTKEGVILLIPAPGIDGNVIGYLENGSIIVAAPMSIPHPEHGWGDGEPGMRVRANVDPEQLRLMAESVLTREDVAGMLV